MDKGGEPDRRRHGRARIHMEAILQGKRAEDDIRLTVENFSAGGFFCRISRPLESMTRLGITFQFPPYAEHPPRMMEAQALIVRCEKAKENHVYTMAACFTELSQEARAHIQGYVDWYDLVYGKIDPADSQA
jgi:c-di-GMP-binding flagellar brake protein YcgR